MSGGFLERMAQKSRERVEAAMRLCPAGRMRRTTQWAVEQSRRTGRPRSS